MKKSILNLENVQELSSESKKNISGGVGKVQIIAQYCCLDASGHPTLPPNSGGAACPRGTVYAEGLACSQLGGGGSHPGFPGDVKNLFN